MLGARQCGCWLLVWLSGLACRNGPPPPPRPPQAAVSLVLSLPWSAWSTFVLEARHGFNKTSPATWVADKIKAVRTVCMNAALCRFEAGLGCLGVKGAQVASASVQMPLVALESAVGRANELPAVASNAAIEACLPLPFPE